MLGKKGFSLQEFMVATAIVGVLLLVMLSLFQIIDQRFLATRERLEAEDLAARAEYLLKLVFSQAQSLAVAAGPIPNPVASGQVLTVAYDTLATSPAAWTRIAVFNREGLSNYANPPGTMNPGHGLPVQTAIWYIAPSVAKDTKGVLMFDLDAGATKSVPATWPAAGVGPTYADPYIDRITTLDITPVTHPNFPVVTSLDVHLTIRYSPNPAAGMDWCPAADIAAATAGCTTKGTWQDVDRSFTIVTRNNLLHGTLGTLVSGATVLSEERVMGNMYFFGAVFPAN